MTLVQVGALASAALLAYWAYLFAVQRAVVFPAPRAAEPEPQAMHGIERIWLELGDARSEAWFLPAATDAPWPLILYAHGNGELIDQWAREFDPVRAWGVAVLLVEYPGYGRSPGRPSERSITRAFSAAYDWAVRQARVDARRIIGHGRSLGGGAVCALARERRLAALVLESTFTSIHDQARGLGMPRFLVRDPFDNLARVREFRGPVLLLHGERDESIPVAQARELHGAAPASQLHVLPCGHNDCPRPWDLLRRFLVQQRLLQPTRPASP
jgi:hypothetical protein